MLRKFFSFNILKILFFEPKATAIYRIKNGLVFRLNKVKKYFEKTFWIDMNTLFPIYSPSSSGSYKKISKITVKEVNSFVPLLNQLMTTLNPSVDSQILDTEKEFNQKDIIASSIQLKNLFKKYGTNKPDPLYLLYAHILSNPLKINSVLEIGIGTNNSDIVSNMGADGIPGASLKGFRDYCPNAHIYGGDIDSRILFTDNRITTFQVDQTNFYEMLSRFIALNKSFDLVIDDGLHSPSANLATLVCGLQVINKNGWIVIEDIGGNSLEVWTFIQRLLPLNFQSKIYNSSGGGYIFALQKI
jgi:hypothetical protein